jgi:hypothetical protein
MERFAALLNNEAKRATLAEDTLRKIPLPAVVFKTIRTLKRKDTWQSYNAAITLQ